MFNWWRNRKRKRLLHQETLPNEMLRHTDLLWQFRFLPPDYQQRLVSWSRVFIAEKNWEGCGGFQLSEDAKASVAGQVGLLTLAYQAWYFDHTPSILVYPQAYTAPAQPTQIGTGVVIHSDSHREGEAWYRGPVILNWHDVQSGGRSPNRGHSLVIHEFAHQMDMINDRSADGIPPLPQQVNSELWQQTMRAEYKAARQLVQRGATLLINDYGLTSLSEFFAVASELFFQTPHELAYYHANVFHLLLDFYQNDFRQWLPESSSSSAKDAD